MPAGLDDLPLFAEVDSDELAALTRALERRSVAAGEVLMAEGDAAEWFGVLVAGEVEIRRGASDAALATLGAGSVVGELALLRATPRTATVRTTSATELLVGDRDALDRLFGLPGVADRLRKTVGQRLAAQVEPVAVALKGGVPFELRPILPTDRQRLVDGIDDLTPESRRRRFFTGGKVADSVIDYLVDLDYANHFAWAAFDADGRGAGVSRYIRIERDEPGPAAELAVTVVDEHQGVGLGSTLVGALGAAGQAAGLVHFTASALTDNRPIKELLSRAGAHWRFEEPGVSATVIEVERAAELIDERLRTELRAVATATMSAAHCLPY